MQARPFFIVSSGRSGPAMLHKALSAVAGVEMHHEYMVQVTQPLAIRRYLGLIDAAECRRLIAETYGAAVVISAPTAAAATAASVGAEVWFMTAGRTWPQLGTDEYPWYANTKVISPQKFGDWSEVMAITAERLAKLVK